MKTIIAGSRSFNDYKTLCEFCDFYLKSKSNDEIEIVSGTANGADKLGERYAQERGYKLKPFPADWEKYKKSAGYTRNKEMAEYADVLIVFWDGKSKGTKHMIDLARENKLEIRIVKFF
jgi:major membrane immunogen (membrane-anchored lipoprotein)